MVAPLEVQFAKNPAATQVLCDLFHCRDRVSFSLYCFVRPAHVYTQANVVVGLRHDYDWIDPRGWSVYWFYDVHVDELLHFIFNFSSQVERGPSEWLSHRFHAGVNVKLHFTVFQLSDSLEDLWVSLL